MCSPSQSSDLQKKYLNSWALGSIGGGASEAFLMMAFGLSL